MSKVVFRRRTDNKQITDAYVDGRMVGKIVGQRKDQHIRGLPRNYEVTTFHTDDVAWFSHYDDARRYIETIQPLTLGEQLAKLFNLENIMRGSALGVP